MNAPKADPREQLAASARANQSRELHVFTVPKHMAELYGIETVGLVELKASEEEKAAKRAGTNPMTLGSESAKESLRMVNGKAVSTFDGTVDTAWDTMHPKIRNMVISAYGKLHQPAQDEGMSFLESQTTSVG